MGDIGAVEFEQAGDPVAPPPLARRALNPHPVARDVAQPVHELGVGSAAHVLVGDLPTSLTESIFEAVALGEGIGR